MRFRDSHGLRCDVKSTIIADHETGGGSQRRTAPQRQQQERGQPEGRTGPQRPGNPPPLAEGHIGRG